MKTRFLVLACLLTGVAALGCSGAPVPGIVGEETVSGKGDKRGSKSGTAKPSRSPGPSNGTGGTNVSGSAKPDKIPGASPSASPTAQATASASASASPSPSSSPAPTPSPSPDLTHPTFEDGRVVVVFETEGLTTALTREIVCFPSAAGATSSVARFQLADGAAGEPAALPGQFTFDLDMALLTPGVAYTAAYLGEAGGAPLASKSFTIPEVDYKPMPAPPLRYRSTKLTLGPAGLTVAGEFLNPTTWRHLMVFDKNRKLVLARHARLSARTESYTVEAVAGVAAGEEATVYIHGDGKIAYRQTIVRTAAGP